MVNFYTSLKEDNTGSISQRVYSALAMSCNKDMTGGQIVDNNNLNNNFFHSKLFTLSLWPRMRNKPFLFKQENNKSVSFLSVELNLSLKVMKYAEEFHPVNSVSNEIISNSISAQCNALWGSCNGKLEIGIFHFWERNISGIFGHG